jgi:bifunctional non-homologous end joining protein LigD
MDEWCNAALQKKCIHDSFVLDGEVVALNENGVPDFQQLQNWRTTEYAIVYYVFDVLHRNSTDFLDLTPQERRQVLDSTARAFQDPIRMSQQFDTDLQVFVASIETSGLEGW